MPDYRRYHILNSTYFITSVTKDRQRLFHNIDDIRILTETINNVKKLKPFKLLAFCFLPDHFHILIGEIIPNENVTSVIHSIKRNFTLNYKKRHFGDEKLELWQKRFWDHIIRNEKDLQNHLDYIHFNPVKHSLVGKPEDYKYSSYSKWLNEGFYRSGWGYSLPDNIRDMDLE